ncbi:MAG: LamG domain-containing protein [Balneolaceae bacterium]|nr:LamG domain-containing protein [Balneolaceae bacterium]
MKITFILFISSCFLLINCAGNGESEYSFINSLTFYASFDDGFEADFANGDPNFYVAPTWSARNNPEIFSSDNEHFAIHKNEGRYSHALWVDNSWTPVYFYKAADNITYSDIDWSGTVSFWLKLTPDEDLPDGFSDPVQLTDSGWNDGALFVDFTDDEERIFRFAFFADRDVWDPELRDWDDVPFDERPMVEVKEPVFNRDEWTHVAFTFRNFNTGDSTGVADCYINGEYVGSLDEREQTITWNPENVAIWLGYNYRGYMDELAIFSKPLNEDEIYTIYSLEHPLSNLLP